MNDGEQTRERILSGALKALSGRGLRRLAMTDVSESSQMARGTIYRYFPNREILLEALMEREVGLFLNGLRESLTDASDTSDAVRQGTTYIIGYVRDHPGLRGLLMLEPDLVLDTLRRAMPTLSRRTYELFTGEDESLTSDLGIPGETAACLADMLLRIVISEYLIPSEEPERFEEHLHALMDTLIEAGPVTAPSLAIKPAD